MLPTARTAAIALSVIVSLGLASCSSGQAPAGAMPSMSGMPSMSAAPSASALPAGTNAADVTFAQMMIPHHEQAVRMSDLLLGKPGLNAQVKTLATQIKSAQAPEIETMTGWLQTWGAPTTGSMEMKGGMGGMLTDEQLDAIETASAEQAQKLYLQGMIGHHQGAVTMANTEIADGSNTDALALARSIVKTQQAEITTMTSLLGQL